MKIIGVTGGTGFIGRHLTNLLIRSGNQVVIFSRTPERNQSMKGVTYAYWNPEKEKCDISFLKQINAVVHLAGASIGDKRWTNRRKKEIIESRVKGTNFLVKELKQHGENCNTFIAASAIGYYGADQPGGKSFNEHSPPSNDFLGKTCQLWEVASKTMQDSMRTVILRFGIVLGADGGVFPKLVKPISYGIVPILGSGDQMVSWIHVNDLARIMLTALDNSKMQGIYNAVAPHPITHKALMQTIATVKGSKGFQTPIPAFALNILLGELSTEVLKGSTVNSHKLQETGFHFKYAHIESAIKEIITH